MERCVILVTPCIPLFYSFIYGMEKVNARQNKASMLLIQLLIVNY